MHFPFERVSVFIFPLKDCAFQGGLCAWLCNGCFGGCAHLVRVLAPGTPLWKDGSVTALLYCSITVLHCYRDTEGSSCISVGSSCIAAFQVVRSGCAQRLCASIPTQPVLHNRLRLCASNCTTCLAHWICTFLRSTTFWRLCSIFFGSFFSIKYSICVYVYSYTCMYVVWHRI